MFHQNSLEQIYCSQRAAENASRLQSLHDLQDVVEFVAGVDGGEESGDGAGDVPPYDQSIL